MKKLKYLLLILLSILILPIGVLAEGEEDTNTQEESNEVIVYFFRGEGCSHCAEAEEWFKSIEGELGDKFKIQDYETWYNEDNAELMKKVAKVRKEEDTATGVPYIIIGDQSWVGFDQSYANEIKEKINQLYDQDVSKRYDVMSFIDKAADKKSSKSDKSNDVAALIIIVLACGGIGTGIYYARKQNI